MGEAAVGSNFKATTQNIGVNKMEEKCFPFAPCLSLHFHMLSSIFSLLPRVPPHSPPFPTKNNAVALWKWSRARFIHSRILFKWKEKWCNDRICFCWINGRFDRVSWDLKAPLKGFLYCVAMMHEERKVSSKFWNTIHFRDAPIRYEAHESYAANSIVLTDFSPFTERRTCLIGQADMGMWASMRDCPLKCSQKYFMSMFLFNPLVYLQKEWASCVHWFP